MKPFLFTGVFLSLVLFTVSAVDPLCQTKSCQPTEVCRVVETCLSNSCTYEAVCLSSADSTFYSGGCRTGEPVLERKSSGSGFQLRTCYAQKPCGEGFYCSAELQDVASRCCRAAPASTKAGICPLPEPTETFFCVDQCVSDADCAWDTKCCQTSTSCAKKRCSMPEPCSVKNCAAGETCVVDPDFNAACVPGGPPPLPLDPSVPAPVGPGGSGGSGTPVQATSAEPLCAQLSCQATEECRVVESCNAFGTCDYQAVCLPQAQSNLLRGGCHTGEPLLEAKADGSLDLRTCYTSKNCAEGFYCSTALQDVGSRCCRAAAVTAPPKDGSCPVPERTRTFFCVDECRSDADCLFSEKCCTKSSTCNRKTCLMPDPCSVKNCDPGFQCMLDPDNNAACVPAQPPTLPSDPMVSPPISPNTGYFWDYIPSFSALQQQILNRMTCPYPGYPSSYECSRARKCGTRRSPSCPRGTYCCATVFCGNICRTPIPY